LSLALAISVPSFAAPIAITSYGIQDATMSGYGGWMHTFTGTITPVRAFTNGPGGPPGTVANYTNGSGTLNDGELSSSPFSTQLFVSGTSAGLLGTDIAPVTGTPLATT